MKSSTFANISLGFLIVKVALIFQVGCSQSPTRSEIPRDPAQASWNESMQDLSVILSDLLPRLHDSQTESDPKKQAELIELAKRLSARSHQIDQNSLKPSSDPGLKFVIRDLNSQLKTAQGYLTAGRWEQGRRQLGGAIKACIACHTMKSTVSSAATISNFNPKLETLTEIEKADFYASIRQFEKAIVHYENALADAKWADANREAWYAGIKKLLAVIVRAHNHPGLTMEVISRFFDADTVPEDFKPTAKLWRSHAKEWRREKKKLDFKVASERLIQRARKENGKAKLKDGGFVLYLRASALLHMYLTAPDHSQDQSALFLAGQAAEGLAASDFWSYPEDYYTACMNLNQATELGKQCSERYNLRNPASKN